MERLPYRSTQHDMLVLGLHAELFHCIKQLRTYVYCFVPSCRGISIGNLLVDAMSQSTSNTDTTVCVKKCSADNANDDLPSKRFKTDSDLSDLVRKKKVAMLLVYSGKGYLGMQRNPGVKTIEEDLLVSLEKASVIRPDHKDQPGKKMAFQRAARTDKGVSAAGQVVSLKMLIGNTGVVESINNYLPEQIRVLGIKRVTKGFDCKNSCDSRTYIYVTPTFVFAVVEEEAMELFRMSDEIRNRVGAILEMFTGTHNFHNFTSGKKPNDPSAKRYIMKFTVGEPFEHDGMEFVVLTVRGQSFMQHQIRKMIGLTIAIMRGYVDMKYLQHSWSSNKVDIPKAPSLGLILETVHYDAYNRKYGKDGLHEEISWDQFQMQIEEFKHKFIYSTVFSVEKHDESMKEWLSTLSYHSFEIQSLDECPCQSSTLHTSSADD